MKISAIVRGIENAAAESARVKYLGGYMTLPEANETAHRRTAILAAALADTLEALLGCDVGTHDTWVDLERDAPADIVNRAKALLKKVGR